MADQHRLLLLILLLCAAPGFARAQPYRVFDADGTPTTLDAVADRLSDVDVLFLGETHDDSLGHVVEHRLLEAAHARRGAATTLSLEMFSRDVQPIVDEYLAGLITEEHFLASSRPWTNYSDYRPLVEFARAHGLPVVAANAPRRYINRVSRLGVGSLDALPDHARAFLAPLPHPPPSDAYRAAWDRLMSGMAHGGHGAAPDSSSETPSAPAHGAMPPADNMLAAQALWDATMAHSIATHLLRRPDALVVHAVGAFHVERGAGLPDVLGRYRPGTRSLVVAIRPDGAFTPADHAGLGDFVVLTGTDE